MLKTKQSIRVQNLNARQKLLLNVSKQVAARILGFHLTYFSGLPNLRPAYVRVALVVIVMSGAQLLPFSLRGLIQQGFAVPLRIQKWLDVLEPVMLTALNAYVAFCCIGWFWVYFADRPSMRLDLRPGWLPFIGTMQKNISLNRVEYHEAQLVLVTVPLMLASIGLFLALMLAQVGDLIQTISALSSQTAFELTDETKLPAEKNIESLTVIQKCEVWGNDRHRFFPSMTAYLFGISDNDCFKIQAVNSWGAYFLLFCSILKSVFLVIMVAIFIQFGTLIIRRAETRS